MYAIGPNKTLGVKPTILANVRDQNVTYAIFLQNTSKILVSSLCMVYEANYWTTTYGQVRGLSRHFDKSLKTPNTVKDKSI